MNDKSSLDREDHVAMWEEKIKTASRTQLHREIFDLDVVVKNTSRPSKSEKQRLYRERLKAWASKRLKLCTDELRRRN